MEGVDHKRSDEPSAATAPDKKADCVCSVHGVGKCTPIKLRGEGEPPSREVMPDGQVKLTWHKEHSGGSTSTITTYE